jgi:hypothetical protein
MADLPTTQSSEVDTGTPRWVKVFGIIAIVLVLLLVIIHLTGHSPSGHTSHPSLTEHGAQHP